MDAPNAAPRRPGVQPQTLKPSPAGLGRGRGARLRDVFRRSWRLLQAVAGWVPLTLLGLFTAPLLYFLVYPFAQDRNDCILTVLALGGLGVQAGAALLVVLVALWLRFRRQSPPTPLTLEADKAFRTGYSLGRIGWLPLVRIELTWERPADAVIRTLAGGKGLVEEATAGGRALRSEVVRRIRVSDLFGLARITFRRRLAQEVRITPSRGQVRTLNLFPQNVAGDVLAHPDGQAEGDRLEMRRYAPGDPLKHVLWKVYARTGRLLVRTPERAVAPCERTMAYLIAAEGDEPSAGVARAVLENGLLGPDFLFGADGAAQAVKTVPEAIEQLLRSADARSQGAAGLETFVNQGATRGLKACLLFAPAQPGPWLERVAALLAARRGPFRVILGCDGLAPASRGRLVQRLLVRAASDRASSAADVRRVVHRLQRLGADVCVVDRVRGCIVPPNDL
ncbi:MAG TPA: DUF58 domain-containing protein [Gemmataceae bacterium]|nr:DUF58 domain-containing protein [Gemmataceae bacterium]